jgi:hypothetical protein
MTNARNMDVEEQRGASRQLEMRQAVSTSETSHQGQGARSGHPGRPRNGEATH